MFGGDKGTTCNGFYGGQCGVVFELSPPKKKGGKWTEKVLHNFAGGTDGANLSHRTNSTRNGRKEYCTVFTAKTPVAPPRELCLG